MASRSGSASQARSPVENADTRRRSASQAEFTGSSYPSTRPRVQSPEVIAPLPAVSQFNPLGRIPPPSVHNSSSSLSPTSPIHELHPSSLTQPVPAPFPVSNNPPHLSLSHPAHALHPSSQNPRVSPTSVYYPLTTLDLSLSNITFSSDSGEFFVTYYYILRSPIQPSLEDTPGGVQEFNHPMANNVVISEIKGDAGTNHTQRPSRSPTPTESKPPLGNVSPSPAIFPDVEVVDGPARLESMKHLFGGNQPTGSSGEWNFFRVATPNSYFIQRNDTGLQVILLMADIAKEDLEVAIYGDDEEGTHDFIAVSGVSPSASGVNAKYFAGVRLLKGRYVVPSTKVGVRRGVVRLVVPRDIWPWRPEITDDDFFSG